MARDLTRHLKQALGAMTNLWLLQHDDLQSFKFRQLPRISFSFHAVRSTMDGYRATYYHIVSEPDSILTDVVTHHFHVTTQLRRGSRRGAQKSRTASGIRTRIFYRLPYKARVSDKGAS